MAEIKVISTINFEDVLRRLKDILDIHYKGSHRRNIRKVISTWDKVNDATDEANGLFYCNINHGFKNMAVNAILYEANNNMAPIYSSMTAIKIINEDTIRIYSKDNRPSIAYVYEINSSVTTNMTIEDNIGVPSNYTVWTSKATLDFINDFLTREDTIETITSKVLKNNSFTNGVNDSVMDATSNKDFVANISDQVLANFNEKIDSVNSRINSLAKLIEGIPTISNPTNAEIAELVEEAWTYQANDYKE